MDPMHIFSKDTFGHPEKKQSSSSVTSEEISEESSEESSEE